MLYGDVVGKNPIRKLVSDFIKYFSQIQTLNLFFFNVEFNIFNSYSTGIFTFNDTP